MSKKSWKGNPRYNKKKSVRSIQPAEKIAQTTAVTPQSSTKTTLPKTTTATKTMPDYKDVYIELKRIGILFVIIVLAIVILWLLLR
jgi:hypothetical protein